MAIDFGRPWFAPKRSGYGAYPSVWEGWAATAVFIFVFTAIMIFSHGVVRIIVAAAAILAFTGLAYVKTSGPWRWR